MSRFTSLLNKYFHQMHSPVETLALDIGSVQTRVAKRGRVLFHEPTCVAIHTHNQEVIAFGQAAAHLIGKTPPSVEVIWPVRYGQVVNIIALEQFLILVMRKIGFSANEILPFKQNIAKTAVSAATTKVQREMVEKIFQRVHITFRPFGKITALAHHANGQHHSFFIDIGGMSMELGVLAQDKVAVERTVRSGGEQLTEMIRDTVRRKCHMEIGRSVAEEVKKEIIRLEAPENKPRKMVTQGRDVLTGLPSTFSLSSEIFQEETWQWARTVEEEIRRFCMNTPSGILTASLSQGIYFTGGASILPGLAEFLSHSLKAEFVLSRTPTEDLVQALSGREEG
jgi:rod shape-determining protein MreB